MKQAILPQWMDELLSSCPRAGKGVHKWLFITALKLHRYFPNKDELERMLIQATANCGREVLDSEIANAVQDSQRIVENPSAQIHKTSRWPARNSERIEAVVHDGPKLTQLADASPAKWNDDTRRTEEIIDALFPGNPLLCAALSQDNSHTQRRVLWRGQLAKRQFIVPSPMIAPYGETKSGRWSMRSLANTGPRRFLIAEFDQGTFDQHAALLWHLGKFAPLMMCVHSGGKSLHGWFFVADEPEAVVEKFFRYAVSLGADSATWTRCQLVRMPDGQRENGNRQHVVFFNPKGISE